MTIFITAAMHLARLCRRLLTRLVSSFDPSRSSPLDVSTRVNRLGDALLLAAFILVVLLDLYLVVARF